jgi:hypothetical protein
MEVEQAHSDQNDAAIINNHFGSGVLPATVTQNVLFDSDVLTAVQQALLVAQKFDGTGIDPAAQPSDTNLGNQLEVELTNSVINGYVTAGGRLATKVLIIGLDFTGTPQYDRFYFYKAEKQLTKKHYTRILTVFFVDFLGNNNCSRALGGRITIKETKSFELSRDPVMVAQDIEPNLFFRDFKVSGLVPAPNPSDILQNAIQAGMGPEYSFNSLNINTTVKQNRYINAGDVTTKIGQKFKSYTNNIQKITLLLGATKDSTVSSQHWYDWSGNILISVYPLQTTVSNPTDVVPELAIDFDPEAQPIAQLSYTQAELRDLGYVLSDVLQPVDFIFSATQLASTTNPAIVVGRYYCVTISRVGAAGTGAIFTGVGNDQLDDSRETLYGGTWVDVQEEDLWFQVWTDAAKVADGAAYDTGNGIQINKTTVNSSGATIDYALSAQNFADSGENTSNIAVVQAVEYESVEQQDERTGDTINSRQQFVPSFSFVTSTGLTALQAVSDPLIIGAAQDANPKDNPTIDGVQDLPGLVGTDTFIIVNPDADLLSNDLLGSKLIPNNTCNALDYRIFKVLLCTDGYGDVNGDGEITSADVARASALVGLSLSDGYTQQLIINGYVSTLELLRADVDGDGYITSNDVTLITEYVSRTINSFPIGSTFTHLELTVEESIGRYDGYFDCNGYVRLSGSESTYVVDPSALDPYEMEYDGYLAIPDMRLSDPVFTAVPFVPFNWEIKPQAFWQDYLLAFNSDARVVPAAFTYSTATTEPDCSTEIVLCEERPSPSPTFDPGRNDIMFPDNIIMRRGQILNPDGTHYKVDVEVGHIIIELPQLPIDGYSINIFEKLVADNGDGFTQAGYPAMRFADCTTVKSDALAKNQLRFGAAIQSFVPNIDGYTIVDGYGVIVDDIIGVYLDHNLGVVTLYVKDLSVDPVYLSLITRLEITVYIKKAGWNNATLTIPNTQVVGLLS